MSPLLPSRKPMMSWQHFLGFNGFPGRIQKERKEENLSLTSVRVWFSPPEPDGPDTLSIS